MFSKKPAATPIYDALSGFSFEGAAAFLQSRKGEDNPTLTNMFASMIAALAVGDMTGTILTNAMPRTMAGLNRDIRALDCLAWSVTTLQMALYTRHTKDWGQNSTEKAWLESLSMAGTIKVHKLDKFEPEIGTYWLDRWNEFRALKDPHESFCLLVYLLFTSKGHSKPMKRYPGSPPVLLNPNLGLEGMPAELACGQFILDAVEAFRSIAILMPRDEDEDGQDDDE